MKNFTFFSFAFGKKLYASFLSALGLMMLLMSGLAFGQTSVQNFGTAAVTPHTSQTGSTSVIPNPTSGTTYVRSGIAAASSPVAVSTTSNPLGTAGAFLKATSSTSTSITKASPIIGYTGSTEFYTSFKILLGDTNASNTATSGIWTYYVGNQGTNYNDNTDVSSANNFVGLRFTYGVAGALALTFNNAGTYTSTGLTTSSFVQGTVYTIEIFGNNKTAGTINYTYNGISRSVAVQKFDLYINGTLVGDDLAKGGLAANTAINAMTFTGISSTSNVANIFVDDVIVYNAIPAAVGASSYSSKQSGAWNDVNTWNFNGVAASVPPTSADNVVVSAGHTVTTGAVTRAAATNTTVDGTLVTTGTYTNNGTTKVNGNFQLDPGGYADGTAFTYAATGSGLIFNSGGLAGVGAGNAFWPSTNPPYNVTVNSGSGAQTNAPVGAVAGTLTLNGQLDAVNAVTVNGTLLMKTGGSVSSFAPIYGSASSLIYDNSYSVGNEWTGNTITVGSGVPQNITIQNNSTVTLGVSRGLAGNLNISAGSNFITNGDVKIGGDWTNAGTYTANGKAVIFSKTSGTQLITNTAGETFSSLVHDGGGLLKFNNDVTVSGSAGDILQLLAGTFDLNAKKLTLSGSGGSIKLSGAQTFVNTANSLLNITGTSGTKNIYGGTLIIPANVTTVLNNGLDFGNNVTTIAGKLQIAPGGYVSNNAPIYSSVSTLEYNNVSGYNVGAEWNGGAGATTTATNGVPNNVDLIDSSINMPNSDRGLAGRLRFGTVYPSTSVLNLNATSGDLYVGGSWVNYGGTFNPNNRAVFFNNAASTQTISRYSASGVFGTETFAYLISSKTGGSVQLFSDVSITGSGSGALSIKGAGMLDLQTSNLNFDGTGTILVDGGVRTITAQLATGKLNINAATAVLSANGGSLILASNVVTTLNKAINFGTNLTTINGKLIIKSSGTATESPIYGSGSVLEYNGTGTTLVPHQANKEWSGDIAATNIYTLTAGAGLPATVNLVNATVQQYAGEVSTGILNIDGTSNFIQSPTVNSHDLKLFGNLTNNGTITGNSRTVIFQGSTTQNISGVGTTLSNMKINNSAASAVVTAVPITISSTLDLVKGRFFIGTNNVTANSTTSPDNYANSFVVTNGTGQLKLPVGPSSVFFPVGTNSAYNPIAVSNSGTPDIYGFRVSNTTPAGAYNTKTVTRQWIVTEAVAGGSDLSVTAQYNTGETGAGYAAATDNFIGHYNGAVYSQQVAATHAGANPFTVSSNVNLTPSDLTTGTQYFAVGRDNAFLSIPTKYVISAITPASPTAGVGFSATITATDPYGAATNLSSSSSFVLSSNGNAGVIGGTVTGTIASGSSSVVVSGIILPSAGTGVILTAAHASGSSLASGSSSVFNVLEAATHVAFVGVPATGNVNVNLASFTVQARRPDNSVDNTYTGTVTISKASGSGNITGTLTANAVAGIATFNAIQFDAADTYTLYADSGSLAQATSGDVVVTLAPINLGIYTFTGTACSVAALAPSSVVPNITFSQASVTGETCNNNNSVSYSVGGTNWGSAFSSSRYVEFTATPSSGYSLTSNSVTFDYLRTGAGATTCTVRSSADNYTTDLIAPFTVGTSSANATITLSGTSFNQQTTPITFRIYGWGGNSTGDFRLDNITLKGNLFCVQPNAYMVTGGGAYCTGGSGSPVGLANSQLGMNYQLKNGAANVGAPVAGTGSAISFGNQITAGNYTVVATNTNGTCNLTTNMTGSASVTINPLPNGTLTNVGAVCAGTQPQLTFTASSGTAPFTLVINGQTYTNVTSGVAFTATGTAPTANTTYTVSSISGLYCTNLSPSVSTMVNVNPLVSAGTVSGASSVFIGRTTPYTANGTAGGTWTSDNPAAASVDSSSGVVTGHALGTAVITYTVNSGCGSPTGSTATITVTDVTTWTGTSGSGSWNHGAPNSAIKAAMSGSYDTSVDGEFSAFNLTVNAGGSLVITKDKAVTLAYELTNNGNVMIESDGNLLQVNDSPANTGAISARREITVKDNQQYNYLISPLVGSNLKTNVYEDQVSHALSSAPFTLYYNEANNKFYTSSGAYIPGRGLAVKEPAGVTGKINALFTGVPMNGPLTYALANTGTAVTGYNLIGNPYPSNIDLNLFYNLGTNSSKLNGTFYFWDNTVNSETAQQGSGYSGAAYAVFNAVAGGSGTGLAAGSLSGSVTGSKEPTRVVKPGQGFMVRSSSTVDKTIDFSNTIRIPDAGDVFFGKSAKGNTEDDRFYLKLSAPTNITTQAAVVYFANGNDGFAKDDSEMNGAPSDVLYSLIGDKKAVINGRAPFVNTDVVPLGTKHFTTGSYIISLGKKEGIFANGQAIYLNDKNTGTITNLSEGGYTFAVNAGESTGRFEIVYQPETVLATDGAVKEEVSVYRDGTDFVVKAQSKIITVLEVYDMAGRLIERMQPDRLKVTIHSEILSNGAYLLKINQGGATVVKKILK